MNRHEVAIAEGALEKFLRGNATKLEALDLKILNAALVILRRLESTK